MHRSSLKTGAVLVLSMVVLAACVHQSQPKVAVDRLEASLVFGAKKPTVDKPLGGITTPTGPGISAGGGGDEGTGGGDQPVVFKGIRLDIGGSGSTQTDCPAAPDGASADRPNDPFVTHDPLVGAYRFRQSGYTTQTDPVTKKRTRVPLEDGSLIFAVTNFNRQNPDNFTYDFVRPAGSSAIEIDHLLVRSNATQVNPGAGVPTARTDLSNRQGEPERGVVLKGIEFKDGAGNSAGTRFSPTTGLLLLPLPVTVGEAFKSVAVDNVHGRTIVYDARVSQAQRVDACGKLVDGFLVDGQLQDTAPAQNYRYQVAFSPAYGALPMIVEEDDPRPQPEYVVKFQLGQLKPDPLPPGF